MNWNEVGAIASAAGCLVAAAGLILIYFQIRHFKRQITGSAASSLYDQMIQVDLYFAEHPDKRAYFYSGKEIAASDPDYAAINSLAEMMVDVMEHLLVQQPNLPPKVFDAWIKYSAFLYDHSPVIRQHLTVTGDWGSDVLEAIGRGGAAGRPSP